MKKYEDKLVGILSTIIFHLVVAIIFMSVKLSSVYHEKSSEFLVEFQPDQKFVENDVVEVPKTLEELFRDDDRYRDIIKNIANPPDVQVDAAEYEDRVKEELIQSGKLSKDNFIDERKNESKDIESGDTALDPLNDKNNSKEDKNKESSNEIAAKYQGPTRIYYNLSGRYQVEMPIPIYKCEGSGVVVINILVNQEGEIVEFKIDEASSSTSDQCLIDAATDAVRRTRFNPDDKADPKQKGSITFHFVAQ